MRSVLFDIKIPKSDSLFGHFLGLAGPFLILVESTRLQTAQPLFWGFSKLRLNFVYFYDLEGVIWHFDRVRGSWFIPEYV